MLSIERLTKGFGSGSNRLEVLKGIELTIEQGELVALMGPSGSGKSTLLNVIGGLLAGDGGSIHLDGASYGTRSPSRVYDVRRTKVGWIFQDFHLLENLSALDNVIFALELSGVARRDSEKRAMQALEAVDPRTVPTIFPTSSRVVSNSVWRSHEPSQGTVHCSSPTNRLGTSMSMLGMRSWTSFAP